MAFQTTLISHFKLQALANKSLIEVCDEFIDHFSHFNINVLEWRSRYTIQKAQGLPSSTVRLLRWWQGESSAFLFWPLQSQSSAAIAAVPIVVILHMLQWLCSFFLQLHMRSSVAFHRSSATIVSTPVEQPKSSNTKGGPSSLIAVLISLKSPQYRTKRHVFACISNRCHERTLQASIVPRPLKHDKLKRTCGISNRQYRGLDSTIWNTGNFVFLLRSLVNAQGIPE